MQDKTKNIIITIGFAIILILVLLTNIFKNDKEISTSERRKLAKFPKITVSSVINGDFTKKWEDYVSDQFTQRDLFRSIKSFCSINILKQKDNNNLFEKAGAIYKIEYPLKEANVSKSADKINEVYETYLKDMNVYYAIIPDKNYYLENDDHLKMDYGRLKEIMHNKLANMTYIDIWNTLKLDDYYKTDLHWRQENLSNVVNRLQHDMNLKESQNDYQVYEIGDFYGTYYGQLGIKVEPDKMYVLTNEMLDKCSTYNFETKATGKVYEQPKTSDMYDLYLSGATPIISIENVNAEQNKELLLFRDSFGSSIAPLLMQNYKKITLIDLRYVSSKLLDTFIKFENQDVLFLYNTLVLNQNVLK